MVKSISLLDPEVSFADADSFPFSDVSAGRDKRITGANLRSDVDVAKVNNVASLFAGKRDLQAVNLLGYYTQGDGGGGLLYWDSASTETANGITIFQVDGVATGRWKRLESNKVDLSWAGFTGTGNEAEKLQAVLDIGKPVFSIDNTIRLTSEVSIDQSDIEINLINTKIIQAVNSPILSINGDWGATQNVTSVDTVNYEINGNTPATNVTRLTLDATPTVAKDDVIKIFSTDRIPKTGSVPTSRFQHMGHFCTVSGVSGNFVYLTGVLPESGLYTTSVRVAKLNRYKTIIKGLKIEVDGTHSSSAVALNSCHSPVINGFECLKGSHRPLLLKSCYAYKVSNVNCEKIDTEAGSRQGYAVFDLGCGYGQVNNISGSLLRHVYSNDADFVAVGDVSPERSGWSHDATINNGRGISCTHAAWDTHTASYNTTFNNCDSIDSHSGKESTILNSPGSGLQARGWLTKFNNCNVRGGRFCVRVAPNTDQNITGIDKPICIVNGGNFENDQLYLLRVETSTGFTNDNIIFNNINCSHRGSNFVVSIEGKCGLKITNSNIRIQSGSPADFLSIVSVNDSNGESNATMNDVDIYDSVDATTRRLFLLQNATIGKMRARSVRIHSATNWNRLVRLTAVAATGGEADIEAEFIGADLSSTVADSPQHLSKFAYSQTGDTTNSFLKSVNVTANTTLPEIQYIKNNISVSLTNNGAYNISAIPSGVKLGQVLILSNLSAGSFTLVDGGSISVGSNQTIAQYDSFTLFWNGTNWIKG